MSIRFAIWAAVSSRAQAAADKISLPHQENRARETGLSQGWRETSGPFIVPGESRTQYIDLADAEADIPELRAMLNAAQRHEFDVLIAYDTNRFRNLLKQVYWSLADYGVQLYFVTQPVPVQPPNEYDPSNNDTLLLIINVAAITSDSELAQIRRRYKSGMPKRITEKGLPVQIPYGYRRPQLMDATRQAFINAVPEPDPAIAPIIIKMKDLLLAGKSTRQIVEYLESERILPPRSEHWHNNTVLDILRNPFYAGYVRWGISKVIKDRRNQTMRRSHKVPQEQIKIARGKHSPLWDDDTHATILAIIDDRKNGRHYAGRQNNEFTGLLVCGVCGGSLWRYGNGPREFVDRRVWRCHENTTQHIVVAHTRLIELVANGLQASLKPYIERRLHNPIAADSIQQIQNEIAEQKRQRTRLDDAYLRGSFTVERFGELAAEIDARLHILQDRLARATVSVNARTAWLSQLSANIETTLEHLPTWMRETDPDTVNAYLRELVANIAVHTVDGDVAVTLNFLDETPAP